MKKIHYLITLTAIMLMATACRIGGRHNVIVEDKNGKYVKVEYWGQVHFTEDKKSIQSMSSRALVKFSTNNDELQVENDHGRIVYEINGGGKQARLDDNDKLFVARAISEMVRLGHNADR